MATDEEDFSTDSPHWGSSPRPYPGWPAEGGSRLGVRADGAEVAPFALEVISPARIDPTGVEEVLDRARPLVLNWSPDPRGEVHISVGAAPWDPSGRPDWSRGALLTCIEPPESTGATLPPELLGVLPAGGAADLFIGMRIERRASASAGGVTLRVLSTFDVAIVEIR
jgi:hypothetical protein